MRRVRLWCQRLARRQRDAVRILYAHRIRVILKIGIAIALPGFDRDVVRIVIIAPLVRTVIAPPIARPTLGGPRRRDALQQ